MTKRVGFTNITAGALLHAYRRVAVDLGGPARALNLSVARVPEFAVLPPHLALGDAAQGLKLLDGQFGLGSQTLDVGAHGDPWSNAAPSEMFAHRLHSFDWLDDLCVLGTKKKRVKQDPELIAKASQRAQQLIDRWIALFGKWNPYAWQNDILASRVFTWLANGQLVFSGDAQSVENLERRTSLYRQIKRIRTTYKRTPAGITRLKAAACLVLGGACFAGKQDGLLDRGLDLLDEEIHVQILSDGGHISRSPHQAAQALEVLMITEGALAAREITGSKEIRRAIDRLTPMLSFFSADDGGFFSFNGGGEGDPARHKALIDFAQIKAKQFGYAPHTKYQRLDKNGTIIMIDVGQTSPRPFDHEAHLAPLAFEMTTSAGRLIVNCGWDARQPRDWRAPMRATAAHSTLVLDGNNAGSLLESAMGKKVLGPAVLEAAGPVSCKRNEQENGTWLQTAHEGYRRQYGLSHHRRLYINLLGDDVRGEDSLSVPLGEAPLTREEIPFEIRFHLHPDVKVTLAQNQQSALLIQPGGIGWRFRTDGGPLHLEKSVYLASGSRPRRSEQLVIYGRAYGDGDGQARSNRVRWSLKKMGDMNPPRTRKPRKKKS